MRYFMIRKTITISLSIILSILSILVFCSNDQSSIASILWILSITFLISAYVTKIPKLHLSKKFLFPLSLIISLSLILRLTLITHIPSFVHGDEAAIGLGAKSILENSRSFNIFQTGWYGYPQLTFLLVAIPMKLFGASLLTLRLSSLLVGMCSIVLTYVFVYIFRNRKEAWIASLVLACSHIHIHFSRTGYHYMQGLFFTEISIFLFLIACKYKQLLWFVLAGICTGLGFHAYLSARITIAIICITIGLGYLINKKTFISIKEMLTYLVGFLYGMGPFLITIIRTFTLDSRYNQVFLFNNTRHLLSVYNTTDWSVILTQQFLRTCSFFIGGIDRSVQYGITSAGVDIVTAYILFISIIAWIIISVIKSKYKPSLPNNNLYFLTLFVWIVVTILIGGVLTIDAPFYPRLLLIIIPIVMFNAYGINVLLQLISKRMQFIMLYVILFVVCIINIKTYFIDYPNQTYYENTVKYTELSWVLKKNEKQNILLISDPSEFSLNYETIRFLSPNTQGVTTTSIKDPVAIKLLMLPTMIVIHAGDVDTMEQLKLLFPNSVWHTIVNPQKQPIFYYLFNFPINN